jgi:hypothetical protein
MGAFISFATAGEEWELEFIIVGLDDARTPPTVSKAEDLGAW